MQNYGIFHFPFNFTASSHCMFALRLPSALYRKSDESLLWFYLLLNFTLVPPAARSPPAAPCPRGPPFTRDLRAALPGPGALSPAALPNPGARRTWAPRSLHSEHAAGGQQAEAQPQSQPSRRHVAGPGRRPPPRGGLPVGRRGCGGSGSGAGSAPHGGAVAPRSSGLGAVGGGRSRAMGFLRGAGRH